MIAAEVAERSATPPLHDPARARLSARDRAALGILGLVVVAVALRVEGIATWYWIDEALSVGIARQDIVDIPRQLLEDGSPPVWYVLLHGWIWLFGASAVATHAMSLVFGVAAVPLSWVAGRRVIGERAGWIAAGLAAISPFITYFSRETRMYALVVLLALAVSASFIAAFVDGSDRARWAFAGSLVALLYTHNWGLYTAVACALALGLVVLAAPDGRSVVRRAIVPFALVAVAYLPWAPALLSQVRNTGAPWSFTPSLRDVVRELAALFRDERVLVALALASAAGLAPLVQRRRSRDAIVVAVLAILTVVPLAIGWSLAHLEPSWATRYLAVVVAPLLLFVAAGLSRAGWLGIASVALAAVLIVQPLARLEGYSLPRNAKSNGRAVAERLAPRLAAGDLVVVAQPEAVPLMRFELGGDLTYLDPTGIVEDPTTMDWRDAEERLVGTSYARGVGPAVGRLEPGERVLLVAAGNASRPTDTGWVVAFRSAGRRIQEALRADPRLVLVDRLRGPGSPYVTFDAALYERV